MSGSREQPGSTAAAPTSIAMRLNIEPSTALAPLPRPGQRTVYVSLRLHVINFACLYPQVFGKYVLERELSRGGMARVILATLRGAGGFEKRLVVKQIRDELAFDQ